jgi:hypothetical protein
MNHSRSLRGFILPMTVILVVILGISGSGFMQLDFQERLQALTNVSNHSAFYLANAGIQRGRVSFKIPDALTWTDVLQGNDPRYPSDPGPEFCELCLCGDNAAAGCVIPAFGSPVSAGPPFDATFSDGQYEVRAFNNEPGLNDTDQQLILRARGIVRGEQKLLEVGVSATSGLKLINCENSWTNFTGTRQTFLGWFHRLRPLRFSMNPPLLETQTSVPVIRYGIERAIQWMET